MRMRPGSAAGGRDGRPVWGCPIGGRIELRCHHLWVLSATQLRRTVLFQLLPESVPYLLQTGLRHRPGKTLANQLPDCQRNGHAAMSENLLSQ